MEAVTIRPATAGDARGIAKIHTASWRDTYALIFNAAYLQTSIEADRLRHWARMLNDTAGDAVINVAHEENGQLLGFVCALPDADPERGSRVDNLHVLPPFRGHGTGERLLRSAARTLLDHASRGDLHLWVFEANQRAIDFYLRLGGEITERDLSRIPAAEGKPILCIRWSSLVGLAEEA